MVSSEAATEIFLSVAGEDPKFSESLQIVSRNATGSLWLIGGYVFRCIAHGLYGSAKPVEADFDFIVGEPFGQIVIPGGWEQRKNSYGNPKWIRAGGLVIDFIPLQSLGQRNSKPRFLAGTPLTIQSILFDAKSGLVEGNTGLKALSEKKVAVNELVAAQDYAQKKRKTLNQLLQEKAASLGFTPILIEE